MPDEIKQNYRDILVPHKDGELYKISEFNPAYDCL